MTYVSVCDGTKCYAVAGHVMQRVIMNLYRTSSSPLFLKNLSLWPARSPTCTFVRPNTGLRSLRAA